MSKFYEALETAKKRSRLQEVAPSAEQRPDETATGGEADAAPLKIHKPREAERTVSLFRKKSVFSKDLVVLNEPDSELAEYFRFLRSFVIHPVDKEPPRTILVASAIMGEGKTFVASNLAASISQSVEENVLLIDSDLRKPSICKVFGLGACDAGLVSFLAKNTPLSDLLLKNVTRKLTVLPAGKSAKTPAELLSSERMKRLILEVGSRYKDRFVIIDSSPLELTPESSVIAKYVDAVLLVVRHGFTPRHFVRDALEKIPSKKLLGIVFNGQRTPLGKYGPGRYYKYGYGKK